MRRIVVALTAALLVASLLGPTSAAAASNRTVTKPYTMAHGMVIYGATHATWSIGTAWKIFIPKPGERFVSFSVSDDTDQPVFGHIHIDANGNGRKEHIDFCSETSKPIRLGATEKIEVAVFLGTCPDGTPSLVTQGTVTATFSR
ncbi:MAG: hypothetical protein ACRDI3_03015 [Actinomycetota bacterium]